MSLSCGSGKPASLKKLMEDFMNTRNPVVFEKCCGYQFVGMFREDAYIKDLFSFVDQFYRCPFRLLTETGVELSPDDKLVYSNRLRMSGSTPVYPFPERVVYKIIVHLHPTDTPCTEH